VKIPTLVFVHIFIKRKVSRYFISRQPLIETIWGVFDFAKVIARGCKNKQIDEFGSKFFAKSIDENRSHSYCSFGDLKKIKGGNQNFYFFGILCSSFLVNCLT
jgi:hypothetical protein